MLNHSYSLFGCQLSLLEHPEHHFSLEEQIKHAVRKVQYIHPWSVRLDHTFSDHIGTEEPGVCLDKSEVLFSLWSKSSD